MTDHSIGYSSILQLKLEKNDQRTEKEVFTFQIFYFTGIEEFMLSIYVDPEEQSQDLRR